MFSGLTIFGIDMSLGFWDFMEILVFGVILDDVYESFVLVNMVSPVIVMSIPKHAQ